MKKASLATCLMQEEKKHQTNKPMPEYLKAKAAAILEAANVLSHEVDHNFVKTEIITNVPIKVITLHRLLTEFAVLFDRATNR